MKSVRRGTRTVSVEVTNVSTNGIWLLVDEREHFLRFADFPWFENASIKQISNVQRPSPHHLYWPELDVDLAVESIEHPDAYPLVSSAAKREKRVSPLERARRAATPRASRRRD